MIFSPNSTHLTQPCDAFVVLRFKNSWRALWDSKKAADIPKEKFRDGARGSVQLRNPGKHYYLKLAAEVIHRSQAKTDKNFLSFARKSMIICSLSLDKDVVWRKFQLRPELQVMIKKHRSVFERVVGGLDIFGEGNAYESGR